MNDNKGLKSDNKTANVNLKNPQFYVVVGSFLLLFCLRSTFQVKLGQLFPLTDPLPPIPD